MAIGSAGKVKLRKMSEEAWSIYVNLSGKWQIYGITYTHRLDAERSVQTADTMNVKSLASVLFFHFVRRTPSLADFHFEKKLLLYIATVAIRFFHFCLCFGYIIYCNILFPNRIFIRISSRAQL